MSVRTKFQLCMVRRNTKAIRHKQKLDLTFTNIDLTNVRCQTVIIGSAYVLQARLLEEMEEEFGVGSLVKETFSNQPMEVSL